MTPVDLGSATWRASLVPSPHHSVASVGHEYDVALGPVGRERE